ncbi:DUF2935 domain-containing protein [Pelosinus sp. UFO1]|uniref:DUF2935 domain-containing protein n=1 Tax=Pelosinus sp. UFO1 TaxID=484770 RepID=UPI0004D177E8|nr:DUF2935 domain-containing protein [Pelosinus sp. UFO1]AIF54218.1 Protein of unknown function DUF2935 [Pelosinus sp. UFO1]
MPRQNMSYMVPEPLEPLNVEEMKFWLRIMEEHAIFIKSGLPKDNSDLIDEAESFQREFESLRVRAERVQNDKKFMEIVTDAQVLVKDFYTYKRGLLHQMLECKLAGCNFPLFLDHMAREAEYFLRLLEKMKNCRVALSGGTKAQENVFWLRIMADHTYFISHLLDPSERKLIQTANEFSQEFDELFLQGRDFSSMLQGYPEVPSFKRFIQDVRVSVLRLRDFKRAAQDMIEECRLVGLIPALLADHFRREAEHFLLILTMMEKGVVKNMAVASLEDIGETPLMETIIDTNDKCKIPTLMKPGRDEDFPEEVREPEIEPVLEPKVEVEMVTNEKMNSKIKMSKEPKYSKLESKGKAFQEKEVVKAEAILQEENVNPVMEKVESKTSDVKYKWTGKWPRQLGKKPE